MKNWIKSGFVVAGMAAVMVGCSKDDDFWDWMIPETDDNPTTSQVSGFVYRPAVAPATDANVQQLRVPQGFRVNKFAENLGKPRIITASPEGHVYATDREAGLVMLLQDTNGDGMSDRRETVANIRQAHGLTIHEGKLYIVSVKELYSAAIRPDGTLEQPQMLIDDLPDGGQHPNRTIGFGPDGKLYISVGSTCNSCPEPNPEHATMLQANADGSDRKIFARGLRNTIGFGWHPQTREFWGMDHGMDWLGDNEQKEELNKIVEGATYGWPYIYDDGKYNPVDRPQGDTTYQQYRDLSTMPTLLYQEAHAAPMAMTFYNGTTFPGQYQESAFIAMRGSWNRSSPVGYKVVRLIFENGQPTRFEDFLTGFLVDNNRSHFARLVGVTVNNDGSLLVSDDTNGVIYRVAYQP
ncbi:sorbosone dehydrogenase family protein [Pontibacter qinzhouensis]|uniref:Sorbosone dehydrogenase family protein n=1 Tax=Pontibacter qinzhouensis TaxID=2603253 RepID=A0A5C8KBD7_9BACT|nr:PQQ-dependent sugar dehydrogenase [Pontibacter qinzhouensis]TXK47934.1 sorbosone dehydrogenase family protein [Pontibacter qinzhouensis]